MCTCEGAPVGVVVVEAAQGHGDQQVVGRARPQPTQDACHAAGQKRLQDDAIGDEKAEIMWRNGRKGEKAENVEKRLTVSMYSLLAFLSSLPTGRMVLAAERHLLLTSSMACKTEMSDPGILTVL